MQHRVKLKGKYELESDYGDGDVDIYIKDHTDLLTEVLSSFNIPDEIDIPPQVTRKIVEFITRTVQGEVEQYVLSHNKLRARRWAAHNRLQLEAENAKAQPGVPVAPNPLQPELFKQLPETVTVLPAVAETPTNGPITPTTT